VIVTIKAKGMARTRFTHQMMNLQYSVRSITSLHFSERYTIPGKRKQIMIDENSILDAAVEDLHSKLFLGS
jgi:hypothetical protein